MQQLAETSVFENLKEKLSAPVLFTFAWVFCWHNFDNILFLLYEPLTISTKLDNLAGKLIFWESIFWTIGVLLVSPILNNIFEFYKQVWHRLLQKTLHDFKIKPMVAESKYDELQLKYTDVSSKVSSAIHSEQELFNKLEASNKLNLTQATTIEELKNDIKGLKSKLPESVIKTRKEIEFPSISKHFGKLYINDSLMKNEMDLTTSKTFDKYSLFLIYACQIFGELIVFRTDDGYTISSDGNEIVHDSDTREIAHWQSAFDLSLIHI